MQNKECQSRLEVQTTSILVYHKTLCYVAFTSYSQ